MKSRRRILLCLFLVQLAPAASFADATPPQSQSSDSTPKPPAPVRELAGQHLGISAMAFSSDGKYLATGGVDRSVRIWDPETGNELKRLDGHRNMILSVNFSTDGKLLVTFDRDATALVWDWQKGEGEIIAKFDNNVFKDSTKAFFALDNKIVLTSEGTDVVIWDVETEKRVQRLPAGAIIRRIDVSPDGKRAVTMAEDQRVILWDLETFQPLAAKIRPTYIAPADPKLKTAEHEEKNSLREVHFLDDNRIVITDRSGIWVWDRKNGDDVVLAEKQHGSPLAVSKDGTLRTRLAGVLKVATLDPHTPELIMIPNESDRWWLVSYSDKYFATTGGGFWSDIGWNAVGSEKIRLYSLDEIHRGLKENAASTAPSIRGIPDPGEPTIPPWTAGELPAN